MLTDVSFSLVHIFQQGHSEPGGFAVPGNVICFQYLMLESGTLIPKYISLLTGNEGE